MNQYTKSRCWMVSIVAMLVTSSALSHDFSRGVLTYEITKYFPFKKPTRACLSYCVEQRSTVSTYSCAPFFESPLDGCDLPGPTQPVPDFENLGDQCVPEQLEVAGFLLEEEQSLVTTVTRFHSDCSATVESMHVSELPQQNAPPQDCDDSAWTDTTQSDSYLFVKCP